MSVEVWFIDALIIVVNAVVKTTIRLRFYCDSNPVVLPFDCSSRYDHSKTNITTGLLHCSLTR